MSDLNPLLQTLKIRIPGETFKLPSQGLFYHNGELAPDVVNGEVHVYPMTTHDDILMKTPDKLFTGQAIAEVFARCIPQILKPMELLSKDVDYLLVCLRILTQGDQIDLIYTHDCEDAKSHEYQVMQRPLLQTARFIDPTILQTACTYTMDSGQVVKLRPSIFKTMIGIYQSMSINKTTGSADIVEIEKQLMDVIAGMIVSVDDVTDPDLIRQWMDALPAGWLTKLASHTTGISEWGVDASVTCICKDCKNPMKMEVPINPVGFFT